jgi:hypothetical protein
MQFYAPKPSGLLADYYIAWSSTALLALMGESYLKGRQCVSEKNINIMFDGWDDMPHSADRGPQHLHADRDGLKWGALLDGSSREQRNV